VKVALDRAMKAYIRSDGTALFSLNFHVRWMWVVNFMAILPLGKSPGTHWKGGWAGPRTSLDILAKKN